MLPTNWSAPASSVLRRLSDPRVQQYWDPNHLVATQMKDDARPPQPVQECCVRSGILWDLAAVYAPGPLWSDRLPPAFVFNGPVVDVEAAIEAALGAGTRTSSLWHSPGLAQTVAMVNSGKRQQKWYAETFQALTRVRGTAVLKALRCPDEYVSGSHRGADPETQRDADVRHWSTPKRTCAASFGVTQRISLICSAVAPRPNATSCCSGDQRTGSLQGGDSLIEGYHFVVSQTKEVTSDGR